MKDKNVLLTNDVADNDRSLEASVASGIWVPHSTAVYRNTTEITKKTKLRLVVFLLCSYLASWIHTKVSIVAIFIN